MKRSDTKRISDSESLRRAKEVGHLLLVPQDVGPLQG